ncbi:small ribosomal subunit protein mS23 [Centruroides vittatus]|uniref:small ribosomal subunit protein mS23 n=1 Tax=Centruroides vittatus TaxID=120091 RepID=UPI00350EA219
MAGSRLEKLGTIFSRMTGLLRSGALKKEDKPIWYGIYKAFPPLVEPIFKREVSEKEITRIFYPEDIYRVKFYRKYGSDIIDLADTSPTLSEQYVQIYQELKKKGNVNNLEKATEEALLQKGIRLSRKEEVKKENIEKVTSTVKVEISSMEQYSRSKVVPDEDRYNAKDAETSEALKLSISDAFKTATVQELTQGETNVPINEDALKFIKSSITKKCESKDDKTT